MNNPVGWALWSRFGHVNLAGPLFRKYRYLTKQQEGSVAAEKNWFRLCQTYDLAS